MSHRANILILVVCGVGLVYQRNVSSHGTGATGVNILDWHSDTISRVIAPESTWNNFGIGTVFSPPGQVLDLEGARCLNGPQFDFDVANVFAFDIDETVELEIDFDLETSHGTAAVAYDQHGGAPRIKLINLPGDRGTRRHTEHVFLERARFAGRGDYGTDLQILSVGDPSAALTICDIRVGRTMESTRIQALGWLELDVRDEAGELTPVRVGIYDDSGTAPLPSQAAVQMREFSDLTRTVWLPPTAVNWPSANRYAFYTDGRYLAALPAGEYEIVITKGIEHRTVRREISIEPHATKSVEVTMDRWIDMPNRDLYSGDVHIHFPRRDAEENQSVWLQAQAEDLHVANTLYMDNITTAHYPQLDWGTDPGFGSGIHRVIPGQEGPRSTVRGHTIHLDIQEPVKNSNRYLLYNEVFEAVSAQGGISGFAHGGLGEGLRTRAGIALEAPDGLVKFVEVLQFGLLGTELWFDFLNLGYKMSPAAGSDYPYGGHIGDERNYVRVDGTFSPAGWFEGLAAGHTFVTNGPILDLQADGASMGDEIAVSRGERITVSGQATINPDIDLLDRLELIEQGEVIATVDSSTGSERLEIEHEFVADSGTWIVLRAYGKSESDSPVRTYPEALDSVLPTTGYVAAVSAPVYISVDGQKTWKRDAVAELASEMKDELDGIAALTLEAVGGFEEIWQTDETWRNSWESQHALLVERIEQVKAQYDGLIESVGNP